jgi:hypothetical protein
VTEEAADMTESEEVYAFFHQLGVALSQWANVELQLEFIAGLCSREGRVGFRAIENFRSKAAYVDAILRHRHVKRAETVDAWIVLYKRVTAAASQRNELVHRTPFRVYGGKPGSRVSLIRMGHFEQDRLKGGISIKDVAQLALEFRALALQLDHLCAHLQSPDIGTPLASPSQPARRLTMKEIEAQMREALGRQARPSGALPEQKKEKS